MKDRFKFRVWSEKYGKYIEDFESPIGSDCSLIITQDGELEKLFIGDGYPSAVGDTEPFEGSIEQCTGLKDKNGTLIFEGDIINVSNNKGKIVEFRDGSYGHMNNGSFYRLWNWTRPIEIIGNIHDQGE